MCRNNIAYFIGMCTVVVVGVLATTAGRSYGAISGEQGAWIYWVVPDQEPVAATNSSSVKTLTLVIPESMDSDQLEQFPSQARTKGSVLVYQDGIHFTEADVKELIAIGEPSHIYRYATKVVLTPDAVERFHKFLVSRHGKVVVCLAGEVMYCATANHRYLASYAYRNTDMATVARGFGISLEDERLHHETILYSRRRSIWVWTGVGFALLACGGVYLYRWKRKKALRD